MARKWLTTPEQAAWRSFVSTLGPLMDALEGGLAPHGLTLGDYEVLVHLSEAPERRMRMCDLAQALRLSPSGLTRRLDGLVRHGLVERRASPVDRRVMHAHLTEAGFDQMMAAAPDHVASVRRHLLDPLTPAQIDELAVIFGTVRSRLIEQEVA
ncbi:MAG: MarR family transcriptional regulator [Ilumatobacteraceae bacterium]